MITKHTPEPWAAYDHGVNELCIYSAQNPDYGPCIAVLDGQGYWSWQDEEIRKANAMRIVACVNACFDLSAAEIDSIMAESKGIGMALAQKDKAIAELQLLASNNKQQIDELQAKCDELLAALERIYKMDSMSYQCLETAKIAARKAIAKHG